MMHILEDSPKNSNMLLHSYYKKNYESIINNKINSEKYTSKLIFIPNTPKVAVYLMYKKDLKLDGKNKCFLKNINYNFQKNLVYLPLKNQEHL